MLELLRGTPVMTAGELAAAFPSISRPAVSRHLRVLRRAGLVTAVQDGRQWLYSLDPKPLAEVTQAWFAQFGPLWEESLSTSSDGRSSSHWRSDRVTVEVSDRVRPSDRRPRSGRPHSLVGQSRSSGC